MQTTNQSQLLCNCERCIIRRKQVAQLKYEVAKLAYEHSMKMLEETMTAFQNCDENNASLLFFLDTDMQQLFKATQEALDESLKLKQELSSL